jgi:hypothetical protein
MSKPNAERVAPPRKEPFADHRGNDGNALRGPAPFRGGPRAPAVFVHSDRHADDGDEGDDDEQADGVHNLYVSRPGCVTARR